MKKILPVCILIILFFIAAGPAWAITATLSISSDPGVDSFTTARTLQGRFNISISGTYVGTVHLQRSHDSGSTWHDVTYWTSEAVETTADDPQLLPGAHAGQVIVGIRLSTSRKARSAPNVPELRLQNHWPLVPNGITASTSIQ